MSVIEFRKEEFCCCGELIADFEERLNDDPNGGECEEHKNEFSCCYELTADDMEELGIVADQTD